MRLVPIVPPLMSLVLAACVAPERPDPAPQPTAAPPPPATVEMPADAPPTPFEARPVTPDAVFVPASTYTVVRGDTLRRIAGKTGAGSEAIARTNGLAPPFLIRIGQKLRIPAGRWHRVRSGETGIAIARAYGIDWSRVATVNELAPPYILRVGQRLLLPSANEVATMSLEERASAFRLDIDDLITGGEPALAVNAEPVKPSPARPRPLSPSAAVAPSTPFEGRFDWPLAGPVLTRFGPYGSGLRSEGINIGASAGAPVAASADGVVVYSGTDIAAFGGLVLIRHSDTWTTAYGYASELLVKRGDAVKRGQPIARMGDAPGEPRLHFQIRHGRKPVDPLAHLPRRS